MNTRERMKWNYYKQYKKHFNIDHIECIDNEVVLTVSRKELKTK